MDIVVGILILALGIVIIKYRFQIHNFSGEWSWAETYTGGTVNAIVFIGMLIMFIGIIYPFGGKEIFQKKELAPTLGSKEIIATGTESRLRK